jgi:hypothetical protein
MCLFYNIEEVQESGYRSNIAEKYGKSFEIIQAGLFLKSTMHSEGIGKPYQRFTTLSIDRSFDFVISDSIDDINLTYRTSLRKQIGNTFDLKKILKSEFGNSLKSKSFDVDYRIFDKEKTQVFHIGDLSEKYSKTIDFPKTKVSVYNINVKYKFIIDKISFEIILEKLKKIESENGRLYKSINIFWKDESTKIISYIPSTDIYEKVFNKSFYRKFENNKHLIKLLNLIGQLSTIPLLLTIAIGWFGYGFEFIRLIGLVTLLISMLVGILYFKSQNIIDNLNTNHWRIKTDIYAKSINDKLVELKSYLDNY